MSYKDITPGKYTAKALRGAMGQAKTGTAQVGIEFEIFIGEQRETIWWIGFLTSGALKHTLEKLAVLEFTGDEDFGPGAINTQKEVEIVVEEEVYEGKSRMKVAWINEIGGGRFAGLKPGEAKTMLGGLDLRKEMRLVYAERGGAPKKPIEETVKDVPF